MFMLASEIKRDPVRRWALSDRIFFGRGACHILSGVYLQRSFLPGAYAERIIPREDRFGGHCYVTDGEILFDYRGYAPRDRVLQHTQDAWLKVYDGDWSCHTEPVDFDLLDTVELNRRKMLGPDQYHGDPVARANALLDRIDHPARIDQVRASLATKQDKGGGGRPHPACVNATGQARRAAHRV